MKRNFTQVPNSLIRCPEVSIYAVRIFLVIASYNPSFPSYSQIQKVSGIKHRKTISNAIRELVDRKIIQYLQGDRNGQSNSYKILPEELWDLKPVDLEEPSSHNELGGSSSDELEDANPSSRSEPEASSCSEPALVHKMNSNNTNGKKTNSKRASACSAFFRTEGHEASPSGGPLSSGGGIGASPQSSAQPPSGLDARGRVSHRIVIAGLAPLDDNAPGAVMSAHIVEQGVDDMEGISDAVAGQGEGPDEETEQGVDPDELPLSKRAQVRGLKDRSKKKTTFGQRGTKGDKETKVLFQFFQARMKEVGHSTSGKPTWREVRNTAETLEKIDHQDLEKVIEFAVKNWDELRKTHPKLNVDPDYNQICCTWRCEKWLKMASDPVKKQAESQKQFWDWNVAKARANMPKL